MAVAMGLAVWVSTGGRANAALFVGSGTSTTDSEPLAASADFELVGGNLQITIMNTSTTPTAEAADVLSGIFFTVDGANNISVNSEYIPKGDVVFNDTSSSTLGANLALPGTVLGQSVDQWEYAFKNMTGGVGSAGLNFFNGNMVSKDGLVSPNYKPTDGLKNDGDTIFENSIVVTLQGYTGNLSDISNVKFQYGTDTSDTSLTGKLQLSVVPEPNYGLALAALLPFFGLSCWRLRSARMTGK